MPHLVMAHETDPKQVLLDELGDISDVEIFHNQILCAVYLRPNKTKSGIFLTDSTVDEDKYQSKVGLIIKKGSDAFVDDTNRWFNNITLDLHDWVVFRPSDGWNITINTVPCRILEDTSVRCRIEDPDKVW